MDQAGSPSQPCRTSLLTGAARTSAGGLIGAELTPLERADLTAELVRLFSAPAEPVANEETTPLLDPSPAQEKPDQVGQVSAGGRGNKSGVANAARELGKPRSTIQRDLKIAAASPEAKAAARASGLRRRWVGG